MHNTRSLLPFSPLTLCYGVVGVLVVTYIGLIAVVMSSAVLTVEFSQSVKSNIAAVAVLEGQYLANVARITNTNYMSEGYVKPIKKEFVRAESVTALR
ncbi:hypothetical protein EXS57_00660 [Candidatus Kaiserbacteria bacterium]|nr:hypothetical protein [Candidatus Kaiserbacteria bacterium]